MEKKKVDITNLDILEKIFRKFLPEYYEEKYSKKFLDDTKIDITNLDILIRLNTRIQKENEKYKNN